MKSINNRSIFFQEATALTEMLNYLAHPTCMQQSRRFCSTTSFKTDLAKYYVVRGSDLSKLSFGVNLWSKRLKGAISKLDFKPQHDKRAFHESPSEF